MDSYRTAEAQLAEKNGSEVLLQGFELGYSWSVALNTDNGIAEPEPDRSSSLMVCVRCSAPVRLNDEALACHQPPSRCPGTQGKCPCLKLTVKES